MGGFPRNSISEVSFSFVCSRKYADHGVNIRADYEQSKVGPGRIKLYQGSDKKPYLETIDMTLRPGISEDALVIKLNEVWRDMASLTGLE